MHKFLNSLCLFVFLTSVSYSQELIFDLDLTLQYITQTQEYYDVLSDMELYSLKHKVFHANVLPHINMSATLPNFDRSISMVPQYDGSYSYKSRIYANSDITISISQLVPFTGGQLILSTTLNRLDNLTTGNKYHSYNYNIGSIYYKQTLWGFNEYKWLKKKDLLEQRYENVQYLQRIEKIKYTLVESFFTLLNAQRQAELNKQNLELSSYIYNKTKELYAEGRVSKADFVEVEIDYLKEISKEYNVLDLKNAEEKFCNLLQLPTSVKPTLMYQNDTSDLILANNSIPVIVDRAIEYDYRISNDIDVYEKKITLKQMESASKPEISLNLGIGLDSEFGNFSQAFDDKLNSEIIAITFSIPLYDGNASKNRIKIANTQLDKTVRKYTNDQVKLKNVYRNELVRMDYLISTIKRYSQILELLEEELGLIKLQVDQGRLNFEQYIRLKTTMKRDNSEYYAFVKEYFLLVFKYRYIALYDIQKKREIK